jgi:hypothetical protein
MRRHGDGEAGGEGEDEKVAEEHVEGEGEHVGVVLCCAYCWFPGSFW